MTKSSPAIEDNRQTLRDRRSLSDSVITNSSVAEETNNITKRRTTRIVNKAENTLVCT